MRLRIFVRVAAALLCVVGTTTAAKAQNYHSVGDQMPTVTLSQASFSDMVHRLEALESRVQKDGKDGKDGWEDTSSEKFGVKVGGRIMYDYNNIADQNDANLLKLGDQDDFVEARRVRLFAEGKGYGVFEYKLQLDFADDVTAMKDVYFAINDVPLVGQLVFGHRKAPFSLEELTSSKYITFMERSLPNVFAPGRELGVTVFNHAAGENVAWGFGAYFDDVDEGQKEKEADNMGILLAGRMTATPYYDEPSKGRYLVHVGLGGVYRDVGSDTVRFRQRPEAHIPDRWISTGTFDASNYGVLGLEAAAVWGSLSLQSEFMYVSVDDQFLADKPEYYSAYVYGSWFLTGEHRPYSRSSGTFGRVKPLENFWIVPGCVGTGAWELTARWSYLDLGGGPNNEYAFDDNGHLAGDQSDLTLGVNWYWNPNMRWMVNYIHTWNKYDDLANQTAEADILAVRGQIDF